MAASSRRPLLELLYRQFLTDEHSASFIKEVSTRYSISTLERLAQAGSSSSRCCATLALGFLADFSSNQVLAGCLHDESDAVRMIAERSIREVWLRDGSDRQRQQLSCVIRMNASGQLDEAIVDATELIESLPEFAAAWHQRARAYFQQREFAAAAAAWQQQRSRASRRRTQARARAYRCASSRSCASDADLASARRLAWKRHVTCAEARSGPSESACAIARMSSTSEV